MECGEPQAFHFYHKQVLHGTQPCIPIEPPTAAFFAAVVPVSLGEVFRAYVTFLRAGRVEPCRNRKAYVSVSDIYDRAQLPLDHSRVALAVDRASGFLLLCDWTSTIQNYTDAQLKTQIAENATRAIEATIQAHDSSASGGNRELSNIPGGCNGFGFRRLSRYGSAFSVISIRLICLWQSKQNEYTMHSPVQARCIEVIMITVTGCLDIEAINRTVIACLDMFQST